MADARINPEAPPAPEHVATQREDYRPPDWLVPEIALDFALDPAATRVRATLKVTRNGDHDRPLRLDGDGLTPLKVAVDGGDARWSMDGAALVIELAGDRATIETEVEIAPAANTKLMGLYASGGVLCTQCESEGFRRITFHPDRPDVLVALPGADEADKARFPVLLANGNLRRQSGDGGRRPPLGANGRIRSPSRAICSRWSPATSPPTATASPPCAAATSISPSGSREADLPQTAPRDGQPEGGDGVGRAGLWPRI